MAISNPPPPLNWLAWSLGIIGFCFTLFNLFALYGNLVRTLKAAPMQLRDALGNLRTQICEEREALRHQQRQRPCCSACHPHVSHEETRLPLQYSDSTLALHATTLNDLWTQFKALERPFLVPSDLRAEAIYKGGDWREDDLDEKVRIDVERHGETGTFANWTKLYRCDLAHRFIWWQSKDSVENLSRLVQKVMLRRMERETTQVRLMVMHLLTQATGGSDVGYNLNDDCDRGAPEKVGKNGYCGKPAEPSCLKPPKVPGPVVRVQRPRAGSVCTERVKEAKCEKPRRSASMDRDGCARPTSGRSRRPSQPRVYYYREYSSDREGVDRGRVRFSTSATEYER